LLERWIVDPEVEAAAAQRIREVAGPIRSQDDVRTFWSPDGAELRHGDLEVGKNLEEERLELLVGAVDLVAQQHGRASRVRDRLQQRALEQERLGEDLRFRLRDGSAVALLQTDVEELLGVVPLVERGRSVEPRVALQ